MCEGILLTDISLVTAGVNSHWSFYGISSMTTLNIFSPVN